MQARYSKGGVGLFLRILGGIDKLVQDTDSLSLLNKHHVRHDLYKTCRADWMPLLILQRCIQSLERITVIEPSPTLRNNTSLKESVVQTRKARSTKADELDLTTYLTQCLLQRVSDWGVVGDFTLGH